MRTHQRLSRVLALLLSAAISMSLAGGVAFAKKDDLDDKTRADDDRSSNSGSSSSGSGSSGSSGSGGSGSGSNVSGGRDGYDRASDPKELTAEEKLERQLQQGSGQSVGTLDSRMRNDRDFGDRFR